MANPYFVDDAERFAHKAWQTLKLVTPVNVDFVAERLGIRIYKQQFSEEIDGMYLLVPGAPPVIAVNNSYTKPVGRQRFTIAHEIGHHLLGGQKPVTSRFLCFDGVKTRKTQLEKSCDRFAALLLMPEHLVREWHQDLSSNPENRISIMTDRFGVSSWAMRVRLRELGLPYRKWDRTKRF